MARFEDSQSVSSDPVVVYVEQSHFRARKSKMAAKIQDGGRKFWILWTKKLDMIVKNSHTKNGACCRSVTGQKSLDQLQSGSKHHFWYGSSLGPYLTFWSKEPKIFVRHLGFWRPSWIFELKMT